MIRAAPIKVIGRETYTLFAIIRRYLPGFAQRDVYAPGIALIRIRAAGLANFDFEPAPIIGIKQGRRDFDRIALFKRGGVIGLAEGRAPYPCSFATYYEVGFKDKGARA